MQAILHLPNCEANAQGPNILDQNHGIWSEMGPYGSVGAHIKIGRSHMAHDHFQTPPDPKKVVSKSKNDPKIIPEILLSHLPDFSDH